MDRAPKLSNVRVIPTTLEQLWAFRWADGREIDLPAAREPTKDTRDFLLLQNAKLDMLSLAVCLDDSSHFAWIDFGVMKIVRDPVRFWRKLRTLRPAASCIMAPGCWDPRPDHDNDHVNWRFCGGFLLADRASILPLAERARAFLEETESRLTWEVNVWAELENRGQHFDWYKADHDDTILPSSVPRICLVMIVKNESAIIERCLASALPHIDTWCITDTGSTDDTVAKIERFFEDRGIPGRIARAPFEDFAQARNASLDNARAMPDWDYALLIDADMVLRGAIDKKSLTAPAYKIVQHNGNQDYMNARMVLRGAPGIYFGVTHEYLSTADPADLPGIEIDDLGDGGSKSDKSDRDVRLLLKGLEKEPLNERYMFYLAQTYRERDQPHRAIPWYRKRIERGGWDEEIYYSHYGIAICYKDLDDEAKFIRACFEAYNYRPWRAEPLQLLATYFREKGKNESACLIAEAQAQIKRTDEQLFLDRNAYDYGAKNELSIAGFHSRVPSRRAAGYKACSELTVHPDDFIRTQARKNFTYYAKSALELFQADVRPIKWMPPEPGWAPMNPSVFVGIGGEPGGDGKRRLVLVRTVNYVVSDGQYPTNDGSGIIRTKNYVVEMDNRWRPIVSTLVRDMTGIAKNNFPVEGFEDCRLWANDENYVVSTTVRDLWDNANGHCEMAIVELDEAWRADDLLVIRDYQHEKTQKNWMPIVGRPGAFLYLCHPTIAIEVANNGRTVEIARHLSAGRTEDSTPISLIDVRGGSQLIPHRDGWICLVHEVAWRPERVYLHRFVRFDAAFKIVALSDLFYFQRVGIEFCAGLARDGDRLVASFGVNDASAHLAFFGVESVENALKCL
jgi:glycosyltransferase involved in cell wall biosynthesis